MAASTGIVINGLTEFRSAIRTAAARNPVELSAALKKAGFPILMQARANAPRVSGRLSSGYGIGVRGVTATIYSRTPYGGGAEWGERGKWAGWVSRYGPKGRFAWKAVEQQQSETMMILDRELREIVAAYGWFH